MIYSFRRYLWSGLWRTPLRREPSQAHHAYLERLTANEQFRETFQRLRPSLVAQCNEGCNCNRVEYSVPTSPTIRERAYRKHAAGFFSSSVLTGKELRAKPLIRLAPCSPVWETVKLGDERRNQRQLFKGRENPSAGRRDCAHGL